MECLHQPVTTFKHAPGPCSVLLARSHQIAWGWLRAKGFHDENGLHCDLLRAPIQEIVQRLRKAWQQHVQSQANSRKTMKGIATASPAVIMTKVAQQSPEAQALLRCSLNGTFWTADHLKHHARPEDAPIPSGECVHCGQPDSQIHRHWKRPWFAQCRPFKSAQIEALMEFPPSFLAHGWMPEPPLLSIYRALCLQIPDEHQSFEFPVQLPDGLHLFIDGG